MLVAQVVVSDCIMLRWSVTYVAARPRATRYAENRKRTETSGIVEWSMRAHRTAAERDAADQRDSAAGVMRCFSVFLFRLMRA